MILVALHQVDVIHVYDLLWISGKQPVGEQSDEGSSAKHEKYKTEHIGTGALVVWDHYLVVSR